MGRVVREDALAALVDQHVGRGLVNAAAARHAGLAPEDFEPRVQAVLVLMPFLAPKLPRLRPELLAGLAADIERTATRLLQLRALLPTQADAAAVLSARPSLLLDGEWERLPAGLDALLRRFSEGDVARLVHAEPSLLLEDVDGVLRELQRLVPAASGGADPLAAAAAILAANPSLATSCLRLRDLSIW